MFFDTAAADEIYFVKVFFYLGQKRKNRNHVSAAAAASKHDCLVFIASIVKYILRLAKNTENSKMTCKVSRYVVIIKHDLKI